MKSDRRKDTCEIAIRHGDPQLARVGAGWPATSPRASQPVHPKLGFLAPALLGPRSDENQRTRSLEISDRLETWVAARRRWTRRRVQSWEAPTLRPVVSASPGSRRSGNGRETICVTVLVENSVTGRELRAEHGLAYHVQAGRHALLFDTGQSDLLGSNARELGCDSRSLKRLR